MSDDDWMGDDYDYNYDFNREEWRTETQLKLEYYESEYRRLKESTSLLELAMWKARMDDSLDQMDYFPANSFCQTHALQFYSTTFVKKKTLYFTDRSISYELRRNPYTPT